MMTLKLCIARPWEPPLPGAELVLFADPDSYTAEAELKEMLTTAMRYAKRHKVYVVPGRFSVSRRLCLCLIGPDGKAMGDKAPCISIWRIGVLLTAATPCR